MIYIVLPVFNRKAITLNFIKQLQEQTYYKWHLLLVDDGSSDGTSISVNNLSDSRIEVLETKGDLWWGGSLQYAYLHLKGNLKSDDIVLIINDDVTISERYLENGARLIEQSQNVAYISPCYDSVTNDIVDKGVVYNPLGCSFKRNIKDGVNINCASTRGLFLNASDYINSGGIDSNRFPHYLSDYDFTLKLVAQGITIQCNDEIRLYSDQATTGAHTLPNIFNFNELVRTLNSNRCSLNYVHWIRFINKNTSSRVELILSYIRYHLLLLKKIFTLL